MLTIKRRKISTEERMREAEVGAPH